MVPRKACAHAGLHCPAARDERCGVRVLLRMRMQHDAGLHTSAAYVSSIRQHMPAYVRDWRCGVDFLLRMRMQHDARLGGGMERAAYVSIRQHTSAYVSICQHSSAYAYACACTGRRGGGRAEVVLVVVPFEEHSRYTLLGSVKAWNAPDAYVSIRPHASAYVPRGAPTGTAR